MKAAIDIGSNSIRLALGGVKRSVITKLADGIAETGRLSNEGVERTIAALKEFAYLAKDCEVIAFATEAVRRASDGKEFMARVKKETGLTVTLLSPEQEAEFALLGATKPAGAVTVCDLGGGSMELISSSDGKTPEYVKSLPLGVVVLKNTFKGDYRAAIDGAPALVEKYGQTKPYPLVMIGGSACSLAAAEQNLPTYDGSKINGARITARRLDELMPLLLSDKLSTLRPVCFKRADTLPYGAIIIQALLNKLGVTEFTVSDSGNLDAALKIRN